LTWDAVIFGIMLNVFKDREDASPAEDKCSDLLEK
jgi:hypothetical protein